MDKWETVGPIKKPKKAKIPIPVIGQDKITNGIVGMNPTNRKPAKPKKYSAKTPVPPPLMEDDVPDTVQVPKKPDPLKTQKKKAPGDVKPKEKQEKRRDLELTLGNLSTSDLLSFFRQLQNAGSASDVCLSWIKYSADTLNLKLNRTQFFPPDVNQFPNDLNWPILPNAWEEGINQIITETSQTIKDVDVLGIAFSSLLATIPTLVQRGDPGWGYLLFLRQLVRLDPSLCDRREKTIVDLMESYGNRKEIGWMVLWVVAQAGVSSLKITTKFLLPYHSFKNYKPFVLSALTTITSSSNMAVEYLIEGDEFEEFFEAAFDPKKRRDFEKIYPRVKQLVLKGLKGQAESIFLSFLRKSGEKDFLPLSAYGQEVFSIILGCIENDPGCIDVWKNNISLYPTESERFLSYLSKVPASVKCGARLEKKLIASDEFAVAAAKHPELLRSAKKLQAGLERVALSKRKIFSWKLSIFVLLIIIGGIFYLDVTENGKGIFEKSNTGKFLERLGLLKEAVVAWNFVSSMLKYLIDYCGILFRSINEALQPMLQSMKAKIQEYIPHLYEYFTILNNFVMDTATKIIQFLQTNVFVGSLSPDNLRKLTKDALSFMWSNVIFAMEKLYALIGSYLS